MSDEKPTQVKAPLHLLPARSLRAVAAAMEHGAIKRTPWNWQNYDNLEVRKAEYISAAMRHLTALADPSESDNDDGPEGSGLNHAAHAVAGLLIYLWIAGEDYKPSRLKAKKWEWTISVPPHWDLGQAPQTEEV